MKALDFRDGDIVEVSPDRGSAFQPFIGVVDSRTGKAIFQYVYVRRFGDPPWRGAGGWHPSQCRLLERPKIDQYIKIEDNIILGSD